MEEVVAEPNDASGTPAEVRRPEGAPGPRAAIVVIRLLLLLLAVGAVAAAVVLVNRAPADAGAHYACPMHPEVSAARPGTCPICGMALERTAAAGSSRAERAAVGDLAAVENVRRHKILDFVRLRSLLPDLRELRGPASVESDLTVSAVFYKDQIAVMAADEPGTLTLTGAPDVTIALRRTGEAPTPWDDATVRVRFRAEAAPHGATGRAASALRAGQAGWVELARKKREVLGVPASAIIQSPEGPYVLVSLGNFHFEKRPIEIGETFLKQGFAVVMNGLQWHDLVVARAAFFMDAQRRIGDDVIGEAMVSEP